MLIRASHCGGNPSAVQRRLIQRAAILHLRLALMDEHRTGRLHDGKARPGVPVLE
jgi:hypothetical protein